MRNYYQITFNPENEELLSVSDYNLSGFDVIKSWNAGAIDVPKNIELWINPSANAPADLVGNPLSWLIVSMKFADAIHLNIASHAQLIQVDLKYKYSNSPAQKYFLLHPTAEYGCLHREKSDISVSKSGRVSIVGKLSILTSNIPENVHVFRIQESPGNILIPERIAEVVIQNRFTGISLIRTYQE